MFKTIKYNLILSYTQIIVTFFILEKEDLVNLLIIFANGNDVRRNSVTLESTPQSQTNDHRTNASTDRTDSNETYVFIFFKC